LLELHTSNNPSFDSTGEEGRPATVASKTQEVKSLILSAIGEGVYVLDKEGNTTFVNDAAEAMTGWKKEELIGKVIRDYHHYSRECGDLSLHHDCPIYRSIMDGEIYHIDNEVFWRKDGSNFPVEYTATPIFDDKKLVGTVIVFKDISERKTANQALKKALNQVQRLKNQLQAENVYLQEDIKTAHNFTEIIGESVNFLRVLEKVEQVAATEASILILGETGTGKELIARAIHDRSPRKNKPLVKINCGAIAPSLIESELFGHEKGAFTGAVQQRIGRFELAEGGSIFLDEIGELSLDLQVKLLRVLQEREIERVGSNKSRHVNVRIIVATHRNLEQMISDNQFRMDLFYRLNVFPLRIPALRERRDDIPLLCNHILKKLNAKLARNIEGISASSMKNLMNHSWPGNVRELFNVIERAAIASQNKIIEPMYQFQLTCTSTDSATKVETMAESERQHILHVLNKVNGIIAGKGGAAEILDLPPSTLRARMKRLRLDKNHCKSC
jgi:PAS domain S-box-containing protein